MKVLNDIAKGCVVELEGLEGSFHCCAKSHDVREYGVLDIAWHAMHLTHVSARNHHAISRKVLVLADHEDAVFIDGDQTKKAASKGGFDITAKGARFHWQSVHHQASGALDATESDRWHL
jgi:hypothetical protein